MRIKSSLQKCNECGRLVAIRSKGLCSACRQKQLIGEGKKRASVKAKKNVDPELSGFFSSMLEDLEMRKMSISGLSIPYPSVCNVCHILPKRIYRSVAKEKANILFMTLDEHTRFDQLLDRMDFDRLEWEFEFIWSTAIQRIKLMVASGLVKEKGRLLIEIADRYEFDIETDRTSQQPFD